MPKPVVHLQRQAHNEDLLSPTAGGVSPEEALGPLNINEHMNAPKQLFMAGDATLLRRRPLVDRQSRDATSEGLRRAAKLARILAQNGVVVVERFGEGDRYCCSQGRNGRGRLHDCGYWHPVESCLSSGEPRFTNEIASKHLVVSQFPSGARTFPIQLPDEKSDDGADCRRVGDQSEAGDSSGSLFTRMGGAASRPRSVLHEIHP